MMGEALSYSGGVGALTKARPRSLTSWLMANRLAALGLEFRTIIDAGANVGQFARAMHSCFPQAEILSFEPLDDIADQLEANLADAPDFRVFRTALGDVDGRVKFYRNEYSQSSSVLPTIGNEEGMLKGKQAATEIQVPIARLDTALADVALKPNVLLKMDLQGNEIAALAGAEQILPQCSHLLIETVFEQEYVAEPLFEELLVFVRERGFNFVRPVNFSQGSSGRIVQMDGLFQNRRLTGDASLLAGIHATTPQEQ